MRSVVALIMLLLPGLAHAQGANTNPVVGSVWTYLGPTYGAGWAQGGPVAGAPSTTLNKLACFKNTFGTLLGECDANIVVPQRLLLSSTLSGTFGATLNGGVEITSDTSLAQNVTDVGKINALYVVNKFGAAAGPNAKEGQRAGIFAKVQQDGPVDYTAINYQYNSGIWSWVTVNQGNTDSAKPQNYHGVASLVEIGGANSQVFNLYGAEFDVNAGPTVTLGNRIGVLAAIGAGTFGAPTRAIGIDTAYAVARGSSTDATFKSGYLLRSPNGVWPFASDSVLYGGTAAFSTPNNYVPDGSPAVPANAGVGIDFRGINFSYMEYLSDHFFLDPIHTSLGIRGPFANITMADTNSTTTGGGLIRWMGIGSGAWQLQINTAGDGLFGTTTNALTMTSVGAIGFGAEIRPKGVTVAALPPCNSFYAGALMAVFDATGAAYNAALVGGGTGWVLALCDGTTWRAH